MKNILIVIFILATLLRLYQPVSTLTLSSETAQHYLEIIKLFDKGTPFLNGPLTSHPWLRLSATPYYLFFPIMLLHAFHPLTLVYYSLLSSIITIFLNYIVVKKIFGEKTAFISTFLLTFAPSQLIYSRLSGFFVFVIPLTYLLIWQVSRLTKSKKRPIWPVFAVIGCLTTLHASALFLTIFFTLLFIYQKRFTLHKGLACLAAFLFPNVPFLIQDTLHGFSMTGHLLLWIPYKFMMFLSGKTLGAERQLVIDESISNIFTFFKSGFFPSSWPWFIGAAVFVLLILLFIKKKKTTTENILYLWLFFGIIVLFFHKNPPFHYFATILVLPIILISQWLAAISTGKCRKVLVMSPLLIMGLFELRFIFSPAFLYQNPKQDPRFVPYATQLRIAQLIKNDSDNQKFMLKRIGAFDEYPQESKEQYLYLLWWLGNQPVEVAPLTYTIVEGTPKTPIDPSLILVDKIDSIKILKQKLL